MNKTGILASCAAILILTAGCGGESTDGAGGSAATDSVDVQAPVWQSGGAGGSPGSGEVAVNLYDPEGLKASSKFAQMAVFEGACPPDVDMANGSVGGAFILKTVPVEEAFTSFGTMKKAPYAFVALLRRSDCGVVAFGCTPADLAKHKVISIQVSAVVPPGGACDTSKGQSCNGGICVQ